MAGRVTHLQDWAAKEAGWVPAVTLKDGARIGLENALGRKLTDDEIAAIENEIASIRGMKTAYQKAKVTAQDVKRTLGNIAKLSPKDTADPYAHIDEVLPNEAVDAYRRSDSKTVARINEAMYFSLGIKPGSREWQHPSGENIVKAAAAALENYGGGGKGGGTYKKMYRDRLANYALDLWEQLGGHGCKAWVWGDKEAPIVPFFSHLASIVDDEVLDFSTAVDLLNEAIERTKIMREGCSPVIKI